tara:strand:+ start:439 stop:720 length:282 start_codon:yes stop_codon:yes gene_type:complete
LAIGQTERLFSNNGQNIEEFSLRNIRGVEQSNLLADRTFPFLNSIQKPRLHRIDWNSRNYAKEMESKLMGNTRGSAERIGKITTSESPLAKKI